MSEEKPQLNEKDIYCITRILQGIIYEDEMFYGCRYCMNVRECYKRQKTEGKNVFDDVRKKMGQITGLYMGYQYCSRNPAHFFNYQKS